MLDAFEEGDHVQIHPNDFFGYRKVTVERPLLDGNGEEVLAIAAIRGGRDLAVLSSDGEKSCKLRVYDGRGKELQSMSTAGKWQEAPAGKPTSVALTFSAAGLESARMAVSEPAGFDGKRPSVVRVAIAAGSEVQMIDLKAPRYVSRPEAKQGSLAPMRPETEVVLREKQHFDGTHPAPVVSLAFSEEATITKPRTSANLLSAGTLTGYEEDGGDVIGRARVERGVYFATVCYEDKDNLERQQTRLKDLIEKNLPKELAFQLAAVDKLYDAVIKGIQESAQSKARLQQQAASQTPKPPQQGGGDQQQGGSDQQQQATPLTQEEKAFKKEKEKVEKKLKDKGLSAAEQEKLAEDEKKKKREEKEKEIKSRGEDAEKELKDITQKLKDLENSTGAATGVAGGGTRELSQNSKLQQHVPLRNVAFN